MIKDKKNLNVPPLRFPGFEGEWDSNTLEYYCDINKTSTNLNETFHYIDLEAVVKDELIINKVISKENAPSRARRVLKKNDILYQTVRPYQFNNYYFNIPSTEQYVASTGYAVLQTKQDSKFIYHLLNTKIFNDEVMNRCTGTSYPAINSADLGKIVINLPTNLGEQNKVAKILTFLDSRIEVQRKLIENYKSLIKIIYTIIISVENVKFSSINTFIKQGLIRMIKPSELPKFSGNKIYLSTSSIVNTMIVDNEGFISYENRPSRATMLPIKGSVWFAKMKNSIKVLLADECNEKNNILSTGFYGLISEKLYMTNWLKYVFISDEFNQQKDRFSEGSSMSGIKDSQLNDILIPTIVDEKQLQQIITVLNDFELIIENLECGFKELAMFKEVLLTNLFI